MPKTQDAVKSKITQLKESLTMGPMMGGFLGIVFILFIGKFIQGSLYSIDDASVKVNDFISYSINSWCWILVIILLYGMFMI
jgi:hypothetical protein